jgi:hypothetical protein
MKNFLLVIIAIVLFTILAPIGLIVELVVVLFRRKANTDRLNHFFLIVAISIDQLGNAVCSTLFNATLIKKSSSERFGNPDETISSVLGKNKLNNTLTRVGEQLEWILHVLDKNHSVKNIEYDE